MLCPSCMAENAATRRFCAQCGAALPVPCPACGFENETAVLSIFDGATLEIVDDRFNYGETRIRCLGEIEGRAYVVAYTWRGVNRRIISARKANAREGRTYYARQR